MSILTEIKGLEAAIKALENQHQSPEVSALFAERYAIDLRIDVAKRVYNEKVRDELVAKRADVLALKKQQDAKENPFYQHSVRLMGWFKHWKHGVGMSGEVKLRWVSPNENWVIVTAAGGTAGQGTPMGAAYYYYANATQHLWRVTEGGTFLNSRNAQHQEAKGRLSKVQKDAWMALALADDEGCPFTANADRSRWGGLRPGDYVQSLRENTYGYIYELFRYSGVESVSFLGESTHYGSSYSLQQIAELLRLVKPVEELGTNAKFFPDDK